MISPLERKVLDSIPSRGGVEDTTLEAKAKGTKKKSRPRTDPLEAKDRNARGQGQECSRPRTKDTDPLEAKDKNARGQGPSVFQRKKGLQ